MTGSTHNTSGPAHKVPCAHCGADLDLRDLEAQSLLEHGSNVICDDCNRPSEIVRVQKVTVVSLRQA